MNLKIKSVAMSIGHAVMANGISLIISAILTMLVPKLLATEQYGYWQLYIFFTSYIGFFHFGLQDGMYLRYGGAKYEQLDKRLMHSQFSLLVVFEAVIAALFIIYSLVFERDMNKKIVLCGFAFSIILFLPNAHLQYVLQMTYRVKEYTRSIMLEKIIYGVTTIAILFFGGQSFIWIILADLVGKLVSLIYIVLTCKDIVFSSGIVLSANLQEAWLNIRVGIKLLSANIAAMMIVGITRFAIENKWDIVVFAKVSLAFSLASFILVFLSAVGQVLFPIFKRTDSSGLPNMYNGINRFVTIIALSFPIIYQPIMHIISIWLPQYKESLSYFLILIPMCVFESKNAILINTFFKTLRLESTMLKINGVVAIFSLISVFITVYLIESLVVSVVMVTVLTGIKCIISEIILGKALGVRSVPLILVEVCMTLAFVLINYFFVNVIAFVGYGVLIIVLFLLNKKEFKSIIKNELS